MPPLLTAREPTAVLFLGVGADDYVVKPFRMIELCARIRRLMARRPTPPVLEVNRFGDWKFDYSDLSVDDFIDPEEKPRRILLTEREFRLALALFRHTGQPVSRAYLLECVGLPPRETASRALDSHVYRLRNKL